MKSKTLRTLKAELKQLAQSIREYRRKKYQTYRESWEFRHRHIAYCLLRGRTIDEIENPTTLKTNRDEKYVAALLEKYRALIQQEVAA